jgi:hypothetical protein
MKVRMLVEIEIDNVAMAKQFGDKLAEITGSGAIEMKLAQTTGLAYRDIPHLKDVQVSIIPIALHSDRLV